MNVKFLAAALDDKNQLEIPTISGTGVDVVGRISAPAGEIIINATGGLYVAPGQYMVLDDSGVFKVVARITSAENYDGVHMRITYEVDWLRTYYNHFLTTYTGTDQKVKALSSGSHMIGCSNNTDWLRWLNVSLPVSGNYAVSSRTGNPVYRITTDNTNNAYLIIYKCLNKARGRAFSYQETPGVTACLIDGSTLNILLRMLTCGDHDGSFGIYRPSVVLAMIHGIYFLPGVTVDILNNTTTMSGVNRTRTPMLFEWFNPDDSTVYYVDGITCEANASNLSGHDVMEITYQTSGGYAKKSFTHGLTIGLNDFRDLYYKQYKMYAPFIGQIDVPVKLLCSYGNTETLALGFDYIFNIYDGTINYKWTALAGVDASSWHRLPEIPTSYSGAQFAAQLNNQKLELSNIGNMIGGAVSLATGNVNGAVNAGMSIANAIAQNDIANNALGAGSVSTTSISGFDSYAINDFALTVVETEIAPTFSAFMSEHGYPTFQDVTAYNSNYKMWVDWEYWQPETGFTGDYVFQAHADEIKAQLQGMEYIYIKGV